MSTLYFLEGQKPLVKSFTIDANNANSIIKTAYLNEYLFTSHKVLCPTLSDFHKALVAHSLKGHCLIKGELVRDLNHEPRKDSTEGTTDTDWVCVDLDGAPFATVEDYIASEPCFKDVSYILQYSASHGIPGTEGLRAHLFMQLSHKYSAPYLKLWMKHLNLSNSAIKPHMTLTKTESALRWPLDISINQNDKLIYIAPPIIGKGVSCSIKPAERIVYVAKKLGTLPIERIVCPSSDALKKDERDCLNALRKASKLPVIRAAARQVGEFEVQTGVGIKRITERWEDGNWVRFNINGGDSNAYFHPVDNFELIHNFKEEPSYYTKEIFPEYYKDCVRRRKNAAAAPTDEGDVLLAICDKRTDQYYKVHWNAENYELNLYPTKSEKRLADFMESHGKYMEEVVPQWDVIFNPQSDTIIDFDTRSINTYVPSPYYRAERNPAVNTLKGAPTIDAIMRHCVSGGEHSPVYEHWLNWLACIVQHRCKTTTAWVLSGVSSTGKSLICHMMVQLLGRQYVEERPFAILEDQFNAWMERALLVYIEEIQVSSSTQKKIISGKLKNLISESHASMRGMHSTSRLVQNYSNFIFSSNFRDPVEVDASDDRYNFGDFQETPLRSVYPEFTVSYINEHVAEELPVLFEYLMHRKADLNQAALVVDNRTRKDVVNNNRNSLDMVADALLEGDIEFFVDTLPDMRLLTELNGVNSAHGIAYDSIVRAELEYLVTQGVATAPRTAPDGAKLPMRCYSSKLTRDELNVLFQHNVGNMPTQATKFSRLLGHHNIHLKRLRKSGQTALAQGIEVTWIASEAWCSEHRAALAAPAPTPLRRVR
jgi:hypothetical protein